MLNNCSFSEIYNDPLSYVRAFERDLLDNESNYPAYIAHKDGYEVPERLQDSRMMIMNPRKV